MSDSIDLLIVQCEKHGQVGPLGTVIKCGRCATSEAEEIERLRDELTAVLLERDALDRKCAALALLLYGTPSESKPR